MADLPIDNVLVQNEDGVLSFFCPGCKSLHSVRTNKDNRHDATGGYWSWNGDCINPTFAPSILVYGWKSEMPEVPGQPRCHSFVSSGTISFCSDTEHALAGQSMRLLPDPMAQFKNWLT